MAKLVTGHALKVLTSIGKYKSEEVWSGMITLTVNSGLSSPESSKSGFNSASNSESPSPSSESASSARSHSSSLRKSSLVLKLEGALILLYLLYGALLRVNWKLPSSSMAKKLVAYITTGDHVQMMFSSSLIIVTQMCPSSGRRSNGSYSSKPCQISGKSTRIKLAKHASLTSTKWNACRFRTHLPGHAFTSLDYFTNTYQSSQRQFHVPISDEEPESLWGWNAHTHNSDFTSRLPPRIQRLDWCQGFSIE